jgi:hypothetical protein
MQRMKRGRSTRAVVALLTAALLLLCQSAAAARACQVGAVSEDVAAGAAPCHLASDGELPHQSRPSPCDSAQPASDTFKPTVSLAADLPALTAPVRQPAKIVESFSCIVAPGASGAPPPLRLLHCRLLI